MMNRKRVLLISASMILLCMCVIVGATYALFTDTETVANHLQAGNLDVKFERTYLEYTVLNDEGVMIVKSEDADVDFTETNLGTANVFGIYDESRIVPGSYVKAELKVSHDLDVDDVPDSNVAFDYKVFIKLNQNSYNELANQLYVTVTNNETDEVVVDYVKLNDNMFNAENNGYICIFSGDCVKILESDTFTVQIDFENVLDNGKTNNKAEDLTVYFDLIIEAEQSTSAPINTESETETN